MALNGFSLSCPLLNLTCNTRHTKKYEIFTFPPQYFKSKTQNNVYVA